MSRFPFCYLFAGLLLLSACGNVKIGTGEGEGGKGFEQDVIDNKPSDDELSGTPESFKGTWQGACSYKTNAKVIKDCTIKLTIQQDGSSVTGAFAFTVDNQSGSQELHVYNFLGGNALKDDLGNTGRIGQGGLELRESAFKLLAARFKRPTVIGLNLSILPGRSISERCTDTVCFTATLTRISL